MSIHAMSLKLALARASLPKTPKPPPNPPARPMLLMSYQNFIQLAAEGTIEIDQTRWN